MPKRERYRKRLANEQQEAAAKCLKIDTLFRKIPAQAPLITSSDSHDSPSVFTPLTVDVSQSNAEAPGTVDVTQSNEAVPGPDDVIHNNEDRAPSESPIHSSADAFAINADSQLDISEGVDYNNETLTAHTNSANTVAASSSSIHFDLGEVVTKCSVNQLSVVERLDYLERHFKPSVAEKFHKKSIFKKSKNREVVLSFQHSWLSDYPWLVYSPMLEGGLCKYCILFPPKNPRITLGQLVTQPFQSYEKAKGSDRGILDGHHSSQYHKDAMEAGIAFIRSTKKPETSIEYSISKRQRDQYHKNTHILKSIIEAVLLCGRQNIALRGHRDDNTCSSSNRGNFLAVLDIIAKHDDILRDHLAFGSRNAKYTSKTVQNELIDIIGLEIRKKVTTCLLPDNAIFSIIADEVTDHHANQEVLTICLRFMDEVPSIREVFFDFQHLEKTTGEMIANGIMLSLRKYGLDILKCRGQSYDGAAAMSSERVGVNGRIRSVAPRALYTHCKSHVLNLSIAASCKHPPIRNMVDSVNECFLFFNNSPKRQRFLERVLQISQSTSSKQKLRGLCKTRWVERHTCYETFYELYESICYCLNAIVTPNEYEDIYEGQTWSWDRDTRVKAQGLIHTLQSFQFVIAFMIAKNTLEIVKGIASKLQKSDLDIYSAYSSIDNTIDRLQRFRNNVETEFSEIYQHAVSLNEKVGGTVSMPRMTGRQCHRENAPGQTPELYYRSNVQIPFLDHLFVEMTTRFSHDNRTCSDIFVLVPAIIVKLSDVELSESCEKLYFWKDDMPTPSSLKSEMKEWQYKWTNFADEKPQNLIECFNSADRDMYPNIRVLLMIGCTLPVGSAGAERSFSCFRRTKTYLRSRMNEERLSGLCLMNMHHELEVDINVVMQEFVKRNKRRMLMGHLLFD